LVKIVGKVGRILLIPQFCPHRSATVPGRTVLVELAAAHVHATRCSAASCRLTRISCENGLACAHALRSTARGGGRGRENTSGGGGRRRTAKMGCVHARQRAAHYRSLTDAQKNAVYSVATAAILTRPRLRRGPLHTTDASPAPPPPSNPPASRLWPTPTDARPARPHPRAYSRLSPPPKPRYRTPPSPGEPRRTAPSWPPPMPIPPPRDAADDDEPPAPVLPSVNQLTAAVAALPTAADAVAAADEAAATTGAAAALIDAMSGSSGDGGMGGDAPPVGGGRIVHACAARCSSICGRGGEAQSERHPPTADAMEQWGNTNSTSVEGSTKQNRCQHTAQAGLTRATTDGCSTARTQAAGRATRAPTHAGQQPPRAAGMRHPTSRPRPRVCL